MCVGLGSNNEGLGKNGNGTVPNSKFALTNLSSMYLAILFLTVFPTTLGSALRGGELFSSDDRNRQLMVQDCNVGFTNCCKIDSWARTVHDPASAHNYVIRGFTGAFDIDKAPKSMRCIDWDEPLTNLKTTWINDSRNGKEFHTKIKYDIPKQPVCRQ